MSLKRVSLVGFDTAEESRECCGFALTTAPAVHAAQLKSSASGRMSAARKSGEMPGSGEGGQLCASQGRSEENQRARLWDKCMSCIFSGKMIAKWWELVKYR